MARTRRETNEHRSSRQQLDCRQRWAEIDAHGITVAGRRVLIVGADTALDAAECAARDAECVEEVPAATLDAGGQGLFDAVHCHGLLHRVPDPAGLLRALYAATAPGGTLLITALILDDPERTEDLRFIPDSHAGDTSCWFIPGRLAVRSLLATAGFDVVTEFGDRPGPPDRVRAVHVQVIATRRD